MHVLLNNIINIVSNDDANNNNELLYTIESIESKNVVHFGLTNTPCSVTYF